MFYRLLQELKLCKTQQTQLFVTNARQLVKQHNKRHKFTISRAHANPCIVLNMAAKLREQTIVKSAN